MKTGRDAFQPDSLTAEKNATSHSLQQTYTIPCSGSLL